MNIEFAVPDRSRTEQDNEPPCDRTDLSAAPRNPLGLRGRTGRPHPPTNTTLRTWLNTLATQQRRIIITDNQMVQLHPYQNREDLPLLRRYRHALRTAAAGTHPTWWNYILGRADQLDADDVPDGCTSCGTTGWAHATPDGLPWCDTCWNDLEVPA